MLKYNFYKMLNMSSYLSFTANILCYAKVFKD